jgi:hypothetical protein
MKKTTDKDADMNFYFWLGKDGELESVTENELEERISEDARKTRAWKDVDVVTGD